MWRKMFAYLLVTLAGFCLLRGGHSQSVVDCIETYNVNATGPVFVFVQSGIVCFRCVPDGVQVTEGVTYQIENSNIPEGTFALENGVLVIFDTVDTFDPSNAQTLRCNYPSSSRQAEVLLTVYQPPIITGETTVTEDDTLTLECDTQNSFGQPAAQWFNEAGQQVSMTSTLKVENISRTEDGNYTCRTSTMDPVNSRNSSVVVVVQYPPDVEAGSDDIVFVPVGTGVISISCTYMGIPPVTSITWTHNASNNTLDPVADSSVAVGFSETSSTLNITEVDGESGGFYVCTPVNDVGNNSATTQVRIQLPPGAATALQVTPGSPTTDSLEISWTNPSFTGFSEIARFRINLVSSKQPDGFDRFVEDSTVTTATIGILSPFTEYTIELFVINAVDLEGVGVSTTGMTLSLRLGKVIGLEAEALSSTAIRVTWMSPTVPTNTTAPVERYTITSSTVEGGVSEIYTAAFNQTNVTLSGLEMGTEYLVAVVGVNSAGPGDSDDVSVPTIVDPPSVPLSFEGTVLDPFTISLSWATPTTDGGRPIVRYELNLTKAGSGSEVSLTPADLSHTFRGLDQNTTYTITIRAFNRDAITGVELASEAVETTETTEPVGPPQVPSNFNFSDLTNISVTLSWTDPGGYPDNYTVEIKRPIEDWTNESVVRVPGITDLSLEVTKLTPLTTYDARALSVNFNGPSEYTSPAIKFSTVGMIMVNGGEGQVNNTLQTTSGETVTLACSLQGGGDSVEFVWTRRGDGDLPDGAQQNGGVLTITEAQTEDSGVYVCSASGVEGSFSLSITDPPSGDESVSTQIIIIVAVVGGVALIVFLLVVALAIYCICFHDNGKGGGSPHKRTYSFRPRHWAEASKSQSIPREQPRKELAQSFHMPDEYTATTSFDTGDRGRRSPSPPSHSKNSHAGAEPTTSFQLQGDNTVL